jgi:hypothetical protein
VIGEIWGSFGDEDFGVGVQVVKLCGLLGRYRYFREAYYSHKSASDYYPGDQYQQEVVEILIFHIFPEYINLHLS